MEKKFGVRDQVGYFFGDFAGSLVNIYIDSYFLVFCTYVLGISPFFMGTLFFCAKIWDAVTAPIIGSLPDYYKLERPTPVLLCHTERCLRSSQLMAVSGLSCPEHGL